MISTKIGFDDDEVLEENENDSEDDLEKKRKESGQHFVDFSSHKEVFLPERRKQQLLQQYDCVVVNDFGDDYHLSDEERAEKNQFYDIFKELRKYKHTYRKLPEYIVVMRKMINALDILAESNGVFPPDKFKKMFLRGDIDVCGLVFPEYKGKDRKSISMKYLIDYILSDKDPENFIEKKSHMDFFTDEELDSMGNELFSEGELDRIMEESAEDHSVGERYFDSDTENQKGSIVLPLSKKEMKNTSKLTPELTSAVREIRKEEKRNAGRTHAMYSYELTADDYDLIDEYDRKHGFITDTMIPEFHGDITNDKDYHKYLAALQEYEDTQIKEDYGGKLKTKQEIRQIELKRELENAGWNVRNIYDNREIDRKMKESIKKDKRREKKLKEKLMRISERREANENNSEISSKSKKKKKKKKSKGDD